MSLRRALRRAFTVPSRVDEAVERFITPPPEIAKIATTENLVLAGTVIAGGFAAPGAIAAIGAAKGAAATGAAVGAAAGLAVSTGAAANELAANVQSAQKQPAVRANEASSLGPSIAAGLPSRYEPQSGSSVGIGGRGVAGPGTSEPSAAPSRLNAFAPALAPALPFVAQGIPRIFGAYIPRLAVPRLAVPGVAGGAVLTLPGSSGTPAPGFAQGLPDEGAAPDPNAAPNPVPEPGSGPDQKQCAPQRCCIPACAPPARPPPARPRGPPRPRVTLSIKEACEYMSMLRRESYMGDGDGPMPGAGNAPGRRRTRRAAPGRARRAAPGRTRTRRAAPARTRRAAPARTRAAPRARTPRAAPRGGTNAYRPPARPRAARAPTPAQQAARERFAQRARSGEFRRTPRARSR